MISEGFPVCISKNKFSLANIKKWGLPDESARWLHSAMCLGAVLSTATPNTKPSFPKEFPWRWTKMCGKLRELFRAVCVFFSGFAKVLAKHGNQIEMKCLGSRSAVDPSNYFIKFAY